MQSYYSYFKQGKSRQVFAWENKGGKKTIHTSLRKALIIIKIVPCFHKYIIIQKELTGIYVFIFKM